VTVASYQCHKCVGHWYEIPYHDHQILLDAVHMNTWYEQHVVLGHRHSYASDVTRYLWLKTLTTAMLTVILHTYHPSQHSDMGEVSHSHLYSPQVANSKYRNKLNEKEIERSQPTNSCSFTFFLSSFNNVW